jgi:hypothetical protein
MDIANTIDSTQFEANRNFPGSSGPCFNGATPMDLGPFNDNQQSGKRKKLTEEERAHIKSKNGCLYCRELTHTIDKCPTHPPANRRY